MSNQKINTKEGISNQKKIENTIEVGSCVKIEDSNKIFQIIGINQKNTICWIREWPLNFEAYQTFELAINRVLLSTICPRNNSSFKN